MYTALPDPQICAVKVHDVAHLVITSQNSDSIHGRSFVSGFRIPWHSSAGEFDVNLVNAEHFSLRFASVPDTQIAFGVDSSCAACCIIHPLQEKVFLDKKHWKKYAEQFKNVFNSPHLSYLYASSNPKVVIRVFEGKGFCQWQPDSCTCKGLFHGALYRLKDPTPPNLPIDIRRRGEA